MKIEIGSWIHYHSAAGKNYAKVENISISPAADGNMQVWIDVKIVGAFRSSRICGSADCLKMFSVEVMPEGFEPALPAMPVAS